MNLTPAAITAFTNRDMENFLAAGTPGGIEAQEARGQKDFVAQQTLPRQCPRHELETLGFVFGEDADDIFINVAFPEGWTKVATDHSMWSDLLDNQGRKRGSIFYKAAFYDRSAHMSLNTRFRFGQNYDLENAVQFQVFDCGKVIYKTEPLELKEGENRWGFDETEGAKAQQWLEKAYPDYKGVLAYWDKV